MAAATTWSGSRDRPESVFGSVFPARNHTIPTPEVTPSIGSLASPGRAFGGFNEPSSAADEAANFSRAWSTATRFLALQTDLSPRSNRASREIELALNTLLASDANGKAILEWYRHEIHVHFRSFALPQLQMWQRPIPVDAASGTLVDTVRVLRQLHTIYLGMHWTESFERDAFTSQVKREFHLLVLHSLPTQRLLQTLACYLFQAMTSDFDASARCSEHGACSCRLVFDLDLLNQLREVGLGGAQGERAFAHAVHTFFERPGLERRCFEVDWSGRHPVISRLHTWIREIFAPSCQQALAAMTGNASTASPEKQFISAATHSFGRLRVQSLFEYVSLWPASQGAVLDIHEYLNACGTGEKAYLCSEFSEQIQRRLLHAGAGTAEILSMYINVISVFKLLDNRGVLLEKVAIPIRSYLRSREDTVVIIAASLLADVDEHGQVRGHDMDKVCVDMALAIAASTIDAAPDSLTDWNDMKWVPDPIDAGTNYRSSKSDDVVAYVLGLFESDDFIKALSTVFGDHLLHVQDTELIKETRLIELLKSRLDSAKLQQAEVMLKDVRDSLFFNRRINPAQHAPYARRKLTPKEVQSALPEEGITFHGLWDIFNSRSDGPELVALLKLVARKRDDLYFSKRTRLPPEPHGASASSVSPMQFEAKVLSSYFWPQLREDDFRVPMQAHPFLEKYEQAFASSSGQRKLVWRHALATTDLKLELEDRTVEKTGVEAWKTAIIDAFALQNPHGTLPPDHDPSAGLTVADLMSALDMDEDLALRGVNYWLSHRILYEPSPGLYAVLERLDLDTAPAAADTDPASPSILVDPDPLCALPSSEALLRAQAPVYQNFLEGMLRNGGPKTIAGPMGITAMLRLVLPSFTGGDDDVLWLLSDLEKKGAVACTADLWAVQ